MRLTVGHKLFFMLLIVIGVVVLGMGAFMTWSFERGFVNYIEERKQERIEDFVDRLEDYYRDHGTWDDLVHDKAEWLRLIFSDEPHEKDKPPRWIEHIMKESMRQPPPDQDTHKGPPPHLPIDKRVILMGRGKQLLIGRIEDIRNFEHYPVRSGDRIVGYAGIRKGPPLERIVEARFLERQIDNFLWIALATIIFAAAIAIPLARRLVRPLRAFTRGSRALAAGRYDTRIPVESGDELGQLARDFNALATALERTEAQRRQWVADTSHELRTPLTILRGEIEALQDGMRPFDRKAIDSLYAEIMRLNRLVDDLYELAKSDAGSLSYRPERINLPEIVAEVLELYDGDLQDRQITPVLEVADNVPDSLYADPDRMAQLFRNLVANTLRYTNPGGRLRIMISRDEPLQQLQIDFEDSAPGVPAEELEHLFERFYRVEISRSRETGGAGLGLSICRNIVEAHGGSIEAHASSLGGVLMRIRLPLQH